MKPKTTAEAIATIHGALSNCQQIHNAKWEETWRQRLQGIMENAPSGSGIDSGTQFLDEKSTQAKLVFQADYHHMDEGGSYDGWTSHRVTARSTFTGIVVTVSGRNRNEIKEYLGDVFYEWLT